MNIPDEWNHRPRGAGAGQNNANANKHTNATSDAKGKTSTNAKNKQDTPNTGTREPHDPMPFPLPNTNPANPNKNKAAKLIDSSELREFASDVATSHAQIDAHFIRSIGNDTRSIGDRILNMLPVDHHEDADDAENMGVEPGPSNETSKKRKTPEAPSRHNMTLELDTLLTRLPYKKMMQEILPSNTNRPMPSVPLVTRLYEESYMREPMRKSERQCVMKEKCECMTIDPKNPFIGVEFVVPNEDVDSSTPQMCVLCSRAHTQQLFYDIVFDNASFNGTIQRFGNMHSVPNEYSRDIMLICPPNGPLHAMPLPIVSHERNRYTVVRTGGIRYLRQHGVYFQ